MTWSYIPPGRTGAVDRDKVRYYVGDTNSDEPQALDEEIDFALSEFPEPRLAAALVLRALAAKLTRDAASVSVGGVAISFASAVTQGYLKLATEYDPSGVTIGTTLALP